MVISMYTLSVLNANGILYTPSEDKLNVVLMLKNPNFDFSAAIWSVIFSSS